MSIQQQAANRTLVALIADEVSTVKRIEIEMEMEIPYQSSIQNQLTLLDIYSLLGFHHWIIVGRDW